MIKKIKPKVAVLVGCYNHEHFIAECLESIYCQSHENIEIYISDDCSKDGTVDAIKAFVTDKSIGDRCFLYRQEKNIGIAKNYNFMFDLVRNNSEIDYVLPFAGDDLMTKDKIALQIAVLEKQSTHLACYSNMTWFNSESGKKILNHFNFFFKPEFTLEKIISEAVIPTPTLCLRRSALNKVRYNEDLYYICDYLFAVELAILGKGVSYIDLCLVRYRKHGNSVMDTRTFSDERRMASRFIEDNYGFHSSAQAFARTSRFDDMVEALYEKRHRVFWCIFIKLLPRFFSTRKWFFRFLKTFFLLKQQLLVERNK